MRLGDHDLRSLGEGGLAEKTIKVLRFTNHEDYNKRTFQNDITLIELAQAVDLTTYTPACLAKTSDTNTFYGEKALVYGEKKSGSSDLSRWFQVGVKHPAQGLCLLTSCWRWGSGWWIREPVGSGWLHSGSVTT